MIKELLVLLVFKSLKEKFNQYLLSAYYRGYDWLTVLNAREDAKVSKTQSLPSRTNQQEKCTIPMQGTFLASFSLPHYPLLRPTWANWGPSIVAQGPRLLSLLSSYTHFLVPALGGRWGLCKGEHPRPGLIIKEFYLFRIPCRRLWLQYGKETLVKGFEDMNFRFYYSRNISEQDLTEKHAPAWILLDLKQRKELKLRTWCKGLLTCILPVTARFGWYPWRRCSG